MILKIGSSGEDVKKLQSKLGLNADGAFGPGTETAVKKWQKDNNLTADGIVGEGTWGKMFPQQLITEPAPVKSSTPSGSGFKLENLKGHIPDSVIAQIPDTAKKFNITTPLRLAHFLAQCGHESGGFKAVQENLNYSATGLKGTFSKYFKEAGLAESYQRNPQKIAWQKDFKSKFSWSNKTWYKFIKYGITNNVDVIVLFPFRIDKVASE